MHVIFSHPPHTGGLKFVMFLCCILLLKKKTILSELSPQMYDKMTKNVCKCKPYRVRYIYDIFNVVHGTFFIMYFILIIFY